jgi:hypothetical protein
MIDISMNDCKAVPSCVSTDPETCLIVEEALRDGVMLCNSVTVREQEYLLQNVTSEPATMM